LLQQNSPILSCHQLTQVDLLVFNSGHICFLFLYPSVANDDFMLEKLDVVYCTVNFFCIGYKCCILFFLYNSLIQCCHLKTFSRSTSVQSLSSDRQNLSYDGCLEVNGGILPELILAVLCATVVHNGMHTNMSRSEIYI